MKKIIISIAAVAAMFCSCSKETAAPSNESVARPELVQMSFTVSSEFTKTVLNDDRSVSFKADESIAVFAEGDSTPYQFTTTEGGTSAVFTGSAPSAGKYYAAFPYSSTLKLNGSTIEGFSLGTGSDGTGTGTYNSKKAIAVAVNDGDVLKFKQVCALLKVTVPASVTDLKEVVAFNRDSGTSNTAGALTGSFNVAVASDGTPSVTVTEAKFQTGFVGPSGSEVAVPAGDYYIPVLPAKLTSGKGIDLKINFMDSFIGRAFNGTGLKLESGKVYSLGSISKTDSFVYDSFESNTLSSDYKGNDGALKVIANPHVTTSNGSSYVLSNNMSSSTFGTSGYVQYSLTSDAAKVKYSYSVRSFYSKVRIKIWLGTNAYYPRMLYNGGGTAMLPAKLNGVAVNSQAEFDANVKTDDWNVFEWNASQFSVSSWSSLNTVQIRCFVDYSNGTKSGYDETTNNRTVYMDDLTFVI